MNRRTVEKPINWIREADPLSKPDFCILDIACGHCGHLTRYTERMAQSAEAERWKVICESYEILLTEHVKMFTHEHRTNPFHEDWLVMVKMIQARIKNMKETQP